ncbi:MAG: TonB-dependent receptor [Saprospiraceae bacterium]|nr:TonB-dependent receptor [Saprospiraceae bacterium]
MKLFTFLFTILFSVQLSAQKIDGSVLENGTPVVFANVVLHNAADSTVQKFTYSDDNGHFLFENLNPGNYFIKISYIGLSDYNSELITVENNVNKSIGTISMFSSAATLDEVVVTAQKPLMEIKADRLVLNVAGSVLSTGDDALNLLRKAPGVLVDNNENITLLGKSGVVIYIDDKPSPLRPADLANVLKNMSSNDIESIEIISNPGAKYEAQGSAGIINIKRKKSNKAGLNGSVNSTLRQGVTTGFNSGLTMNYRNEKFSIMGTSGYFNGNNYNENNFDRLQNNLGFSTKNRNNNNSIGYNTRVSADYYLSKKSTIGVIAEFNYNDFTMNNVSNTTIGNTTYTAIDSVLLNNGNAVIESINRNLNANYYFDNGKETTFNIDLNYGRFTKDNNSYTPNFYTTPDLERVTSKYENRIITPTTIDIATFKMDYERKIGAGKMGAGLKSALVRTDNIFNFYNIEDETENLNINLSNRFKYDEWVNAGYINYNIKFKKTGFSAGLRVENSNTEGDLIAMVPQNDTLVKRSYTDFFPSLGFSYTMSDKHSFQLSYGRRINRPNYQDLNPFEFQLDQLTFEKGNAFLNPEYTDNIQLVHTFASRFNTTLSYSHTSDVITRLVDISGLKGSFITWDNIAYRKVLSVGISAPVSISEKWSTFTNVNAVHTRNRADFGEGKTIHLNVNSLNLYHQQTYQMGKGWNAEISGWYNTPSIWEGSFIMNKMWAMGAGFGKKFDEGRYRLSVNVDDIFKTNVWSGSSTFGDLQMNVNGEWDSRRVRATFSYNFGKQMNSKTRKRTSGLEEEQQRIKK